jgi:hypothetical protein
LKIKTLEEYWAFSKIDKDEFEERCDPEEKAEYGDSGPFLLCLVNHLEPEDEVTEEEEKECVYSYIIIEENETLTHYANCDYFIDDNVMYFEIENEDESEKEYYLLDGEPVMLDDDEIHEVIKNRIKQIINENNLDKYTRTVTLVCN